MEIDIQRWHRLHSQLAAMRAAHAGITRVIFDLDASRGRFQNDRNRIATQTDKAFNAEVGEAAARALAEADKRCAAFDAEIAALRAQGDLLYSRMSSLDQIASGTRAWAQRNGVALDDADDGPAVIILPALPPNTREFGAGMASAAIAQPAQSEATSAWPMRAARRVFNMGGNHGQ
jgi:hypothetical protein